MCKAHTCLGPPANTALPLPHGHIPAHLSTIPGSNVSCAYSGQARLCVPGTQRDPGSPRGLECSGVREPGWQSRTPSSRRGGARAEGHPSASGGPGASLRGDLRAEPRKDTAVWRDNSPHGGNSRRAGPGTGAGGEVNVAGHGVAEATLAQHEMPGPGSCGSECDLTRLMPSEAASVRRGAGQRATGRGPAGGAGAGPQTGLEVRRARRQGSRRDLGQGRPGSGQPHPRCSSRPPPGRLCPQEEHGSGG